MIFCRLNLSSFCFNVYSGSDETLTAKALGFSTHFIGFSKALADASAQPDTRLFVQHFNFLHLF